MGKKGGSFFEEHVEKIVLAVVAIVCIWLLASRVLVSPNKVEYYGKEFNPSKIDIYISTQAEDLEGRLNRPPDPKPPYKAQIGDFAVLIKSPINVDVNLNPLQPSYISPNVIDDRRYRIPMVGKVHGVAVEHFRAVAYLPTDPIDEQNAYDEAGSEPNDVDFVTVEGRCDVAELYKSFRESFAGEDVPQEWRDPCLAIPVFAAVQLLRRELSADDSWSDWTAVPRTRIDYRKEMFELIEEAEKLPPGGIEVRVFQFNDWQVTRDLVQPQAYVIASAEEEWFPPSLHGKFLAYQKKLEAQEKREEAERKEKERERKESLRGSGLYADRDGELLAAGRGRARYSRAPSPALRDRDLRKRSGLRSAKTGASSKTTSIEDIFSELEKILIDKKTDISKMHEPLVFWVHDDTVEPGKSYQYRIRLGVFNPIAGTDQVSQLDESKKNDVILWSDFSEVTRTVEIPATLYFFPLKKREAAKIVDVKVSRYVLGYWYGWTFPIQQGEVIGEVRENKDVKDRTEGAKEDITVPETIDYGTGAVLVDVTTMNDWSAGGGKNLHARVYSDMLYSFDGTAIEHMPVKYSFWPKELQTKYSEITKLEKKPRKPLRAWASRPDRRKWTTLKRAGEEFKGEDERGSREDEETEAWQRMMESRGGR